MCGLGLFSVVVVALIVLFCYLIKQYSADFQQTSRVIACNAIHAFLLKKYREFHILST